MREAARLMWAGGGRKQTGYGQLVLAPWPALVPADRWPVCSPALGNGNPDSPRRMRSAALGRSPERNDAILPPETPPPSIRRRSGNTACTAGCRRSGPDVLGGGSSKSVAHGRLGRPVFEERADHSRESDSSILSQPPATTSRTRWFVGQDGRALPPHRPGPPPPFPPAG